MNKEFLNNLIKKSNLNNTDYFTYNKNVSYKKNIPPKITFEQINIPTFKDYIVLDFETTGLSFETDKILEIGAIKVSNGKIIDTFDTLINPKIKIPPYIQKIVKITDEMVKNKPSIEDIFKDFLNFLDNKNLVIHNANFDMNFLIYNANSLGFEVHNKALDTVSVCKKLFKDLKKYNLGYLCKYFDIKNISAHRALSDAKATYYLYEKLYNKYNNGAESVENITLDI